MITWREAWAELVRRRGRSLLSLWSVMIAVAAIVAVRAATDTTRVAYEQVFHMIAGRADLEIVAPGGAAFDERSVDAIRTLPGIAKLSPTFHRATALYANGKRLRALATAIEPDDAESMEGVRLVTGAMPEHDQLLLEAGLADSLDVKVGDTVRMLTSRGMRQQTIAGIVAPDNVIRVQQGGMLLARLDDLQEMFRASHRVDAVQIHLKSDQNVEPIRRDIEKALPPNLMVQQPAARTELAKESLTLTDVSLNLATALSFTTAIFTALSVFLMNVGERQRQFSIARAVGASSRQIVMAVCREALLLGVVGTLLGLPCGMFLARGLSQGMAGVLDINVAQQTELTAACILGLIAGPTICLLAAWYPAVRASRVSPLEGMRPLVTTPTTHRHNLTTVAALVGIVVSFVLTIACVQGRVSIGVSVLTVILSLVSMALLLPALLVPATALLAWPLRRFATLEGEMAQRLVVRHVGRSSLTVAVLYVAIAAGVGTSNSAFSVASDVRGWFHSADLGDFLLRTMVPDMTGQDAATMPLELQQQVADIDGVEWADSLRLLRVSAAGKVDAAGKSAILIARGFGTKKDNTSQIRDVTDPGMIAMMRGEALVGSVLANHAGLGIGDSIEVTHGDQRHSYKIAGVVAEYSYGGATIVVDRRFAEPFLPIAGADSFLIKTRHPTTAATAEALRTLADENELIVQSFSDLLLLIDNTINQVTGGLWLLLVLALFIGALGVVNTLTMNILEQQRELAMMRAIGMRRGQLIRTVLIQAALLGTFGVLLGGGVGLVLARMMNICLGTIFGHYIQFEMQPLTLAVWLGAAIVAVMLAALLPARRAAHVNILEAVRYE